MYLAAALPRPQMQMGNHPQMLIEDQMNHMFGTVFHLMIPFLIILIIIFLVRLAFRGGSSRTVYVKVPSTPPKPVQAPAPQPPNPVPAHIQKLVSQLKEAAGKVTSPTDKQKLLTICETIPRFYKRHLELGADNTYVVKVENKLASLVRVMPVYLHIQEDPDFYTFNSTDDELYVGLVKPGQWLKKASQAIKCYLDLLYAAMRDDSKSEVARFDLELANLLTQGASQETTDKTPETPPAPSPRLAKVVDLYSKRRSRAG